MARSTKPWDLLGWRRQRIDARTPETDQPLVGRLDDIELVIYSGVLAGGPGHRLEAVVPGGRRHGLGSEPVLWKAKRLIYQGALSLRDDLALRPGVPKPRDLARYSHHIWKARATDGKRHQGHFARSANGTLRFAADERDFYEHRDDLGIWAFAPVSAKSGDAIYGWDKETP